MQVGDSGRSAQRGDARPADDPRADDPRDGRRRCPRRAFGATSRRASRFSANPVFVTDCDDGADAPSWERGAQAPGCAVTGGDERAQSA